MSQIRKGERENCLCEADRLKEEEIQLTLLHFDFYDVEKEAVGHSATNISLPRGGESLFDTVRIFAAGPKCTSRCLMSPWCVRMVKKCD